MRVMAVAANMHKWLALLVGVQMLFWVASGLFFAIYPIERVRSEHRIAEQTQVLQPQSLRGGDEVSALLPEAPTRLSYEMAPTGRALAVAEFAARAPIAIDVRDWAVISPLSSQAAQDIARAYVAGAPRVRAVELIETARPEYRGALPAWRVQFDDAEGLAVYVAADTARVTARRSDLWRIYDALWALHIMDWRDHENFNTGLLIAASLLALLVVTSGLVLAPFRLGLFRRRKAP